MRAEEVEFLKDLSRRRRRAGITQAMVASVLGVTSNTVARWERGGQVSAEQLEKLRHLRQEWGRWYARAPRWSPILWAYGDETEDCPENAFFDRVTYGPVDGQEELGNRIIHCVARLKVSFQFLHLCSLERNMLIGRTLKGDRGIMVYFGSFEDGQRTELRKGNDIEFYCFFMV